MNYIKFKNGGNIDEIARSTGNKLVGKRETISRRWEIRSIRYWAVSVNDKVVTQLSINLDIYGEYLTILEHKLIY